MKTAELFDEYDSELTAYFYYLESRKELGDFINLVKPPKSFNLNSIPIKEWFVYFIDERYDYPNHTLISLSKYKEDKYKILLSMANILNITDEIEKGTYSEIKTIEVKNE